VNYALLTRYFCWACNREADSRIPAETYPGRGWPARFCSFAHRHQYLTLAHL
jgi:hypothetical protein